MTGGFSFNGTTVVASSISDAKIVNHLNQVHDGTELKGLPSYGSRFNVEGLLLNELNTWRRERNFKYSSTRWWYKLGDLGYENEVMEAYNFSIQCFEYYDDKNSMIRCYKIVDNTIFLSTKQVL